MNFFFGIKTSYLSSRLNIPRFKNDSTKDLSYNLFSAMPKNNFWEIEKVDCEKDENFFFVDSSQTCNKKIFFLAKSNEIKTRISKLIDFNNYTNTTPEYRANLQIRNKQGGFSSYQSDYPFTMTEKKGSIASSIYALANEYAQINKLFLKNIYTLPVHEDFYLYFLDIVQKKTVFKTLIKTNLTNIIDIDKKYIKKDIYLFTKPYIGIPIFCSINKSHLSFEHTHPPHEYILGNDKFTTVANLKSKINEIII